MIFLDQVVRQALREEGQLIISLEDLMLSMDDMEQLFIDTYEQAKGYVNIYDWQTVRGGTTPTQYDQFSHLKHLTYTAYNNMQRYMPDVPGNYFEFNPYTKNFYSLMNMDFSGEVGKYAECKQLEINTTLSNAVAGNKQSIILPATFDEDSFEIKTSEGDSIKVTDVCDNHIHLGGTLGEGEFDTKKLKGYVTFSKNGTNTNLNWLSKYVGIKELDLANAEILYVWFKANMLTMIGAIKEQVDLAGIQLPFNVNQDSLLQRGRELMTHVEELKVNKSHWSNF